MSPRWRPALFYLAVGGRASASFTSCGKITKHRSAEPVAGKRWSCLGDSKKTLFQTAKRAWAKEPHERAYPGDAFRVHGSDDIIATAGERHGIGWKQSVGTLLHHGGKNLAPCPGSGPMKILIATLALLGVLGAEAAQAGSKCSCSSGGTATSARHGR